MTEKRYQIEQLIDELVTDIANEQDVECDFYGDCYPVEIFRIENKMELSVDNEDWGELLEEAREIFEGYAEGYIEFKNRESEEMSL